MEFTFAVKQPYEKLVHKATREQPREYSNWIEVVEMHFFAEEVYDIIKTNNMFGNIPDPTISRDNFVAWVDDHYNEIEKIVYDTFKSDVVDYDKLLSDQEADREYDYYKNLAPLRKEYC